MRLGQLARKLSLRPSQIVDYLASQEVFPEEGSNARLTDEMTERIVLHFAPERLREILITEENIEPAQVEPEIETPVVSEEKEVQLDLPEAPALAQQPQEEDKPELIKAPKVELTGLKVLGKIELPEKKKKEEPVNQVDTPEQKSEEEVKTNKKQRTQPLRQKRERYGPKVERNPIALQREQKAREEEEKRKQKAERDKERRTLYYQQRVKMGQPTKPVKMINEPVESFPIKEELPRPKTWWGRFMRWLNT